MTNYDYLSILNNNLSIESKWFLIKLLNQSEPINKDKLRDIVNDSYIDLEKSRGNENPKPLITSRYLLDIHTARLEGAGLVHVKELGRMRLYSITDLGKELLNFTQRK
ncbi:hypothetical protein LG296_19625 (plasmid) [Ureibacillus chungkukjangi]|uniref:hypothetical protein n=1 Tax=Ureibacillus chungkukjangi TaxID=1202712 RepID=UPI000D36AC95|nr:hypothetical protein [Ureibacillus chungkukjangi]MCM3390577.1 hypothetical protein [Ureibacillus chungkukjangi]